jgi:hypothetical protein
VGLAWQAPGLRNATLFTRLSTINVDNPFRLEAP